MAKISILKDKEKQLESTLWKMQEQMNTFQNQTRQLGQQMEKIHKDLMKVRDERMTAERLKKAESKEE